MKKIIAILAIAIVLVGAVFAEDHNLIIKATVTSVEPIFKLHLTSGAAEATTNADNAVFTAAGNFTDTQGNAKQTTFSLLAGGTVSVECYVNTTAANKTQTNTKYRVSFSDGVFSVTRANATTSSSLEPTITTGLGTVVKGIKTDGISFATAPLGENATNYASSATNKDVIVQFSGAQMAVGQAVVASANYEYAADDTIVPGSYYATIKMTVTVEN